MAALATQKYESIDLIDSLKEEEKEKTKQAEKQNIM